MDINRAAQSEQISGVLDKQDVTTDWALRDPHGSSIRDEICMLRRSQVKERASKPYHLVCTGLDLVADNLQ